MGCSQRCRYFHTSLSWSSSGVFATLSESGPARSNPVLSSSNLKLNRLPVLTSPTNMLSSYCLPNLSELRNLRAVGPSVCSHVNSGDLYLPFPPKSTKLSGDWKIGPREDPPRACHMPCT